MPIECRVLKNPILKIRRISLRFPTERYSSATHDRKTSAFEFIRAHLLHAVNHMRKVNYCQSSNLRN